MCITSWYGPATPAATRRWTKRWRRGEVLAPQWDDLNFDTGELRIERQVYRANGELDEKYPPSRGCSFFHGIDHACGRCQLGLPGPYTTAPFSHRNGTLSATGAIKRIIPQSPYPLVSWYSEGDIPTSFLKMVEK